MSIDLLVGLAIFGGVIFVAYKMGKAQEEKEKAQQQEKNK